MVSWTFVLYALDLFLSLILPVYLGDTLLLFNIFLLLIKKKKKKKKSLFQFQGQVLPDNKFLKNSTNKK